MMASSLLLKLQQLSPSTSCVLEDIEGLSCPICLEVYEKPRKIPCGHNFCKGCLSKYQDILEPACPVCRRLFTLNTAKKSTELEKMILSNAWLCRGCAQKVPLSKLRYHNSVCPQLIEKMNASSGDTAAPIPAAPAASARTSNKSSSSAPLPPNRHTFRCPYCGLQNLDCHGLLKHCTENHDGHTGKVVCPICASMPWGNPHQKSVDFISHLRLRHRFEYGFVVDFSLDDSEALEKALKASMEEQ